MSEAQDLRHLLARVAFWGEVGVFILTAAALAGPWEVSAAAIALIAGFQSLPSAALGGLLTLTAIAHGLKPNALAPETKPDEEKTARRESNPRPPR